MLLINRTKELITLKIVNEAGHTDSINIQPQGRVTMPEGYNLPESHVDQYKQIIQIVT